MSENTKPPDPRGNTDPSDSKPDDLSDDETEELAQLREAAKVGPWIEIARANTDQPSSKKRRFRRRRG